LEQSIILLIRTQLGIIPLWRDSEATEPNVTAGTLEVLAQAYGRAVTAADLFTYGYAVLASPDYVRRFWMN